MSSVSFFDADVKANVKGKKFLKHFIPLIFLKECKQVQSVIIVFCSDEYLLSLNKQFLDHDYYTDILTFDLSDTEETIGEIYISIDRVKENSVFNKVSFQDELTRIIFHGILHLCGFDDKSPEKKIIMTEMENEYLSKYQMFHVKQ